MFNLAISGILPHRHLRSLPRPRLLAGCPHCARIQQRGKESWASILCYNSIACQIKGRFRKGFLRILVCLLLALFLSINRKHCLDLKRGSQHRLLCDQCPFSKLLWDNMTARYSNCNDRPSSGTILTPISDISCPGAFAVQLCELGLLRLEQRRRPARQGHQAHHRRRQQGLRPR